MWNLSVAITGYRLVLNHTNQLFPDYHIYIFFLPDDAQDSHQHSRYKQLAQWLNFNYRTPLKVNHRALLKAFQQVFIANFGFTNNSNTVFSQQLPNAKQHMRAFNTSLLLCVYLQHWAITFHVILLYTKKSEYYIDDD